VIIADLLILDQQNAFRSGSISRTCIHIYWIARQQQYTCTIIKYIPLLALPSLTQKSQPRTTIYATNWYEQIIRRMRGTVTCYMSLKVGWYQA